MSLVDLNNYIWEDLKCLNEVENHFVISEKIKKLVKLGKAVFVIVLEAKKSKKLLSFVLKNDLV